MIANWGCYERGEGTTGEGGEAVDPNLRVNEMESFSQEQKKKNDTRGPEEAAFEKDSQNAGDSLFASIGHDVKDSCGGVYPGVITRCPANVN